MLAKQIWDTLSKVDVSEHIEKKGTLSYLSWAWAWGMMMKYFPTATYLVDGPTYHKDNTAEVGCQMVVQVGDELVERHMWLPVLDHRNKPIENPNSFDINTAKMRCLTKCLAMYGLGHYIYAGEDLPPGPSLQDWIDKHSASIQAIKKALANDDLSSAAEEWFTLPDDAKSGLWVAPTKGGPFTTLERDIMKTPAFREAYYGESAA